MNSCYPSRRFYSILVRLKGRLNWHFTPCLYPFLFHTGSIKRLCLLFTKTPSILFLFHTGSIKRLYVLLAKYAITPGFYSILVRLKVNSNKLKTLHLLSFLFHTGSIKRLSYYELVMEGHMFLFHTGSIKSDILIRICYNILYTSFYSILVRLKARLKNFLKRSRKVSIPYWFD